MDSRSFHSNNSALHTWTQKANKCDKDQLHLRRRIVRQAEKTSVLPARGSIDVHTGAVFVVRVRVRSAIESYHLGLFVELGHRGIDVEAAGVTCKFWRARRDGVLVQVECLVDVFAKSRQRKRAGAARLIFL
jgi:hypothetical protein